MPKKVVDNAWKYVSDTPPHNLIKQN